VPNGGNVIRPPAAAMGAPHNLWFIESGDRLYVTHSGMTASFVSTYDVSGSTVTPSTAIDLGGMNPFGLTFVPATN